MLAASYLEVALHFKTQKCPGNHLVSVSDPDTCPYFHNEEDRRREPVDPLTRTFTYHNILYMPKLVAESERDKFARNMVEYHYHVLNYKSKPCPYRSLAQQCPLGQFCPYSHPGEDLSSLNKYREELSQPPIHAKSAEKTQILVEPPPLPVEIPMFALPQLSRQLSEGKPPYVHALPSKEETYIYGTQRSRIV